MGFDWEQPKPSRYWASDFWIKHLDQIGGKNSPNDHKTWEYEINFVNNRGKETTLYVKTTANAIGPVGPNDDVWDRYDMDFSAY
jgi:hypothetical protein